MIDNITLPYELEQYVNPNPTIVMGGVSIITDLRPDGTSGRIMKIEAGSGFGYVDVPTSKHWFKKIDQNLDYEISFWFKQPDITPSFEFSLRTFNCADTMLQCTDIRNGNAEDIFITNTQQVISIPDKWHFARYILFRHTQSTEIGLQPITSLANGTNLIMSEGTSKLIVNLFCSNDYIKMWDFKIKPLRHKFSAGFVQGSDMLQIWRKNNNPKFSNEQIDNIANQLLLPYNTTNITIKL